MKTPVEIINEALRLQPNLWPHEVSEDEWHICHWGERIEGEKREWIVVAEACNEDEAKQKLDRILADRNGATAIAALQSAGYRIVQPDFQYAEPGMSLRDYFAGQALVGMLASGPHDCDEHGLAHDAYLHADAMLRQRALPEGTE